MELNFNVDRACGFKSNSQIARVLTENWVSSNSYCPNCGESYLTQYSGNRPVADFYCSTCKEEYELKSKTGVLGKKIVDGAYQTMIRRITSATNPNFFFLTYNRSNWLVNNFLIIPKHFFTPEIIIERKPLGPTAQRKDWVGCNIDLTNIPSLGRIFLIKDSKTLRKIDVLSRWKDTLFLKKSSIENKGWTLDVLNCIDKMHQQEFTLTEIYRFENELRKKHPNNSFIQPKIRQQLQILRDRGILRFISKGKYMKTAK
jgi:type II restriction enzyme